MEVTLTVVLLLIVTLALLVKLYVHHCYGYWERKKVPFLEPKFPLGNNTTLLPKGIFLGIISKKFYDQFKKMDVKLGGVYLGLQPQLVILDPEYIRDVMSKDFQYFVDRGIYQSESDPISVNIFSQPGEEWRKSRVTFTPIFTSAKMKIMFHTVMSCCEGLREALEKFEDKNDIDILEVAGCFTTDVIGSCVFGIECNSLKYPNADFRKMGRKVFEEFDIWDQINLCLSIYVPKLAAKLGVRNIQKDVSAFFFECVKDTVEYRERNNITRQDFLQLLIDLKNSEAKLSMNELTAQAFLFFLAGFETSSTLMTLSLFEMGKNQEVQDKVREEIGSVLQRHDGEVTYEAIKEMKYLGQVIDETLRLWPPVTTIARVCTKDYKFQNNEFTLEKGTGVIISVLGLHHNPEYWPDPLTWDPARFNEDNKKNRRPFVYLPFGEGPRNCIGLRFGIMQTKLGLVTILKNYRVSISPKTKTPLGMKPETFLFQTLNRVYLNLEKI